MEDNPKTKEEDENSQNTKDKEDNQNDDFYKQLLKKFYAKNPKAFFTNRKTMVYKFEYEGKFFCIKHSINTDDSDIDESDMHKEYEISQKINHESIIKILYYQKTARGHPEYITEYMKNGSLSDYLPSSGQKPKKTLSMHQKYIILIGVALGMKFLNSIGIIHRDLKPDNILIDDSFFPKIGDFDTSECIKNFDKEQISMYVLDYQAGTPQYMAPEIVSDGFYTYKVDVFSFSFIFWQLITGGEIKRPRLRNNINLCSKDNAAFIAYRPPTDALYPIMKSFLEKCWSDNISERYPFSQIVEIMLSQEFKSFFEVDENKLSDYLERFQDKLRSVSLEEVAKLKRKSDPENFLKLGRIYYYGYGEKEVDKKIAFHFFKRAADAGIEEAKFMCGKMLLQGDGIDENKPEALEFFRQAAELGHFDATFECAKMLYFGDGVEKDANEAASYMQKSANSGKIEAMFLYGKMEMEGEGVERDLEDAKNYLNHAVQNNNADAMCLLGQLYLLEIEEDKRVDKKSNKSKAARLFREAKTNESLSLYARMLLNGDGIDKNKREAFRIYADLAQKGVVDGIANCGHMLYDGIGVEKNREKAGEYYSLLGDNNDEIGLFNFSKMLFDGDGIKQNKEESLKLMKKAADKGNLKAMIEYAKIRDSIEDISITDKKEAAAYFKKAADCGNVESMISYAEKAEFGDEIEKSLVEASKYYKMAINSGSNECCLFYPKVLMKFLQENAGNSANSASNDTTINNNDNDNGQIASEEEIEEVFLHLETSDFNLIKKVAAFYFKKSADEGNVESSFHFATLLIRGEGVKINVEEAHKYSEIVLKNSAPEELFNDGKIIENFGDNKNYLKLAKIYYTKAKKKGCKNAKEALKNLKKKA